MMSMLWIERLFNILSLYWFFIGATFFPYYSVMVPMLAICTSCFFAFLYLYFNKKIWMIGMVVPCLLFYKDYSLFSLVISSCISIYCLWDTKKGMGIDTYRNFFLISIVIALMLCAINWFVGNTDANIAVYLLGFFGISGIVLLRSLQFPDVQNNKDFQKINIFTIGIWVLISFIFSQKVILNGMINCIKIIYSYTIYPILSFILFIFRWLFTVLANCFGNLFHFDFSIEFPEITLTDTSEYTFFPQDKPYEYKDYSAFRWIPYLIVVLVLIVILYVVFKKLKRREEYSNVYQGETSYIKTTSTKPKKVTGLKGKFRKVYRKYIAYLLQQGMYHDISSTTQEDYEQALLCNKDIANEAGIIKDLYRKVRYDDSYVVTKEDIQVLKKQLEKIKK